MIPGFGESWKDLHYFLAYKRGNFRIEYRISSKFIGLENSPGNLLAVVTTDVRDDSHKLCVNVNNYKNEIGNLLKIQYFPESVRFFIFNSIGYGYRK